MEKAIKILVTFCFASMFYFPFNFTFLPAYNVKMLMAALGVVVIFFDYVHKRELNMPTALFPIFIMAGMVSIVSMVSMTYNRTIDDAYQGYIISMSVWLSAAYVVCRLIKYTHGYVTVRNACNYIIAVCVFQCASAMLIDFVPSFQAFVDSYIMMDQAALKDAHRLYGIGASLDVAGIRFSAALVMIVALVIKFKDRSSETLIVLYVLSFAIIVIIGSMIARTTYVGVVVSLLYYIFSIDYSDVTLSRGTTRLIGIIAVLLFIIISICVYYYNNDASFRYWLRFAFEGFFNLFEHGEYQVDSTETLKTMYVFPDNLKTWIIGDGYFSNPYWSDPNYLWQGQATYGFYMGTDVGYLRFIFYFGLIGLTVFSSFIILAAVKASQLLRDYKLLCMFLLATNFIVWFKVATDLFLVFALLICVGLMKEEKEENEEEENLLS